MILKELIDNIVIELKKNGFADITISKNFKRYWNRLYNIKYFQGNISEDAFKQFSLEEFNTEITNDIKSNILNSRYRYFHAIKIIYNFFLKGILITKSLEKSFYKEQITDLSEYALNKFLNSNFIDGKKEQTKIDARMILHKFLFYCPLENISQEYILNYLSSINKYSKHTIVKSIRLIKHFLSFLYSESITTIDYTKYVNYNKKILKYSNIPSVYSDSEIATLLNYIKNNNQNRKRNYALAILIVVYGLRASDVANIKLEHIDWDKKIIKIILQKNDKIIFHHITELVWNALADYLLNERIQSKSDYVFLKKNGEKLSSSTISSIIFSAFIESGIDVNNRKHGSHALRHSLASKMINNDDDITTIANTLGHESVTTTRIYAKVNINKLKLCELEIPRNE